MGGFQQRWSTEQREAVVSAVLDRGVKPQRRVLELAKAGELTTPTGDVLEPFDMPEGTFIDYVKTERGRRKGRTKRPIQDLPARDAIEELRLRLLSITDTTLDRIERNLLDSKKPPDLALLREAARAVREIQAIPGRGETPTPKPGAQVNGKQAEGPTRTGLSAAILKDMRTPAQEPPTINNTHENTAGATHNTDAHVDGAATTHTRAHEDTEAPEPGSLTSAQSTAV